MEFLHPAALWGAGLIALPIIIHLITRRKALRKPFAAIRFVLLSHKRVRRMLRLKRILILLARIMAVAALALLIAHPTLPAAGDMHIGETPRSLVIVLDNSMSMLAEKDGKRPWDAAQALASSLATSLRAGHEAALIFTNPNGNAPAPSFTADPAALRKQLEQARPSFVYRSMTEPLAEAALLLESARHELRQVLLITDLQRAPWAKGSVVPPVGVRLVVLDVGGDVDVANAAVANVELEPSAGEARYNAEIEIAAFAPEAMPGKEVTVIVEEEVRARGFLDVPAKGRAHKRLTFSASGSGILRGIVHLAPDALAADNEHFFTARAGGRIKALVVDGDPKPERYGAESYYLMNALNPKLEARSRIDPTLVTTKGLAKSELGDYDIVIMANVGDIEPKLLDKLNRYVSEGGALLISLGDKTDPERFAAAYGDLAPAALYVLNDLPTPTHLDPTGTDHPSVKLFAMPENGDISLSAFRKYYLLDPASMPEGLKTVLRYQDGAPAMVEKSHGRGKVALATSTLDRDWNDLCIYPTYLPLLQQFALYLTGGMADPVGSEYTVGETARFTCPAEAATALVFGPGGAKRRVELAPQEDVRVGEAVLEDGPGFYEVFCIKKGQSARRPDGEPDRLPVANIDIRESDLGRMQPKALEDRLNRMGFRQARVLKDVRELAEEEGFNPGRRDAARLLFAALMAMLLFEGLLTRKG